MAKLSSDKIDKFRPQLRNANKHTQRGTGMLEASMRKYGYVAPMTAAADGEIIDGSARIETSAGVFGDDVLVVHHDGTKPVIMVRDDIASADTPEAREISIAANRIAQVNLDFDAEALLGDLQAGVDLEQFWRKDELDELLADLQPKTTGDTPAEIDRAEELRQKWGTAPGQLWQLGEHRLICGDCTDAATVARVMGGENGDIIITDPPYSSGGFQEAGKSSGSIGTRANDTIQRDNLSTRGYRLLLLDALANFQNVDALYIFTDWRMWIECFDVSERGGWRVRSMLVWDKEQMGMGLPWRSQHELILFGKRTPAQMLDGKCGNVLHASRTGNKNHPTEKPVELVEQVLSNTEGVTVVDFFSGSGTTIIACENLARRCRAAEISPAYVAVALERFQQHTGVLPVLIG